MILLVFEVVVLGVVIFSNLVISETTLIAALIREIFIITANSSFKVSLTSFL